ncbi:MAG: glycosyltransferase family 2 protein [Planctomycetota bacterium]
MIKLSIVILSWNTRELLSRCLESLLAGPRSLPFEIIVVDNASTDGSAAMVREIFPEVRLVENERNEGYARGNNIGIRAARGEYVLLLNSDTEVIGPAPEVLVAFLSDHPEYAAASCQLVNPDGTIQRACKRFPTLGTALFYGTLWERLFGPTIVIRDYFMEDFDHRTSCDVDQPPGACCLVPRRLFDEVGLFDESLWLFYNDVDFCKRLRECGYKIRFIAEERIIHHEGASTAKYPAFIREWNLNRLRYYKKHFGRKGALLLLGMTWLRVLEERVRIWRRHRGADRQAALAGVAEIMCAMRREAFGKGGQAGESGGSHAEAAVRSDKGGRDDHA